MFAQQTFNIKKYGAKGNGKSDDAIALQKAIDDCNRLGGGRVLVPAGATYLAGPFELKSQVELFVEAGATLLANPDVAIYTKSAFRENKGEGTMWISAENVEQLTICGGGIIDGNGIEFMGEESGDAYKINPFTVVDPRPHILTLIGGKNIRIRDVTIKNAAYWTIHLAGCNDVSIADVTILNSLKVPNSDGIDIDHSKNVRIVNCHIESGDDCICLKNRREYESLGACENIAVSNCSLTSRSCAIKIGSENMDTIRNVVFDNCIIMGSNRGVGIQNRDEGVVTDVLFSNMIINSHFFSDTWWGKAEPIYVSSYRRPKPGGKGRNWRFPEGATEGKAGDVRNIYFSNIKCQSENGIYVSGESANSISNIFFDNVDIAINKITALPGGVYDRRPCEGDGLVKGNTSAFYFDKATNITMRNCSVAWGDRKADYFAYALESYHVQKLDTFNIKGSSAFPATMPPMKIE
jgi:polygalacturonase